MSQSKGIGPLIKNKFFTGVNAQTVKMNLHQSNFLSFKEGDIIFQAGEKSEDLYLILDGDIKLKILNPGSPSLVREKEKNDFFGDYELLENTNRKSSAVANTDCVLYKIGQREFFDLLSIHPALKDNVESERNENNPNVKSPAYQIRQGFNETGEAIVDSPSPDNLTASDEQPLSAEITETLNESTGQSDLNSPVEIPGQEVPQEVYENPQPLVADDEDLSGGSIFTAALNGDIEFKDESFTEEPGPFSYYNESAPDNTGIIEETNVEVPDPADFMPEPELRETAPEVKINYEQLFFAVQKISGQDKPDEVIRAIIGVMFELFDAQIARVFIYDKDAGDFWSYPFMDNSTEIKRIKPGEGLIGKCAINNEIINIVNPSEDSGFNLLTDGIENIITEDMLLFPVNNNNANVTAVIQLINSSSNGFTSQDEKILGLLSPAIFSSIEKFFAARSKLSDDNLIRVEKITGFISDELNISLHLIKHYADFIDKKTGIKEIKQVANFISEQTNSVLSFSGIITDFVNNSNNLNKKVVDLHEVFNALLELYAEFVESKNIKLFKRLEPDLMVSIDTPAFYHACFQIIKHLCDIVPTGSNIYIISQRENDSAILEFRGAAGLTSNEIIAGFEDYLNNSAGDKLADIGLAIANKIISDLGGGISIASDTEEGVAFKIHLPVYSYLKK